LKAKNASFKKNNAKGILQKKRKKREDFAKKNPREKKSRGKTVP
jgi:hypothetical protein